MKIPHIVVELFFKCVVILGGSRREWVKFSVVAASPQGEIFKVAFICGETEKVYLCVFLESGVERLGKIGSGGEQTSCDYLLLKYPWVAG